MKDKIVKFLGMFEDDVMVGELLELIRDNGINIDKLLQDDKL